MGTQSLIQIWHGCNRPECTLCCLRVQGALCRQPSNLLTWRATLSRCWVESTGPRCSAPATAACDAFASLTRAPRLKALAAWQIYLAPTGGSAARCAAGSRSVCMWHQRRIRTAAGKRCHRQRASSAAGPQHEQQPAERSEQSMHACSCCQLWATPCSCSASWCLCGLCSGAGGQAPKDRFA
jgi:hypothetical protein